MIDDPTSRPEEKPTDLVEMVRGILMAGVPRPDSSGPPCQDCGAIMVRSGACHRCLNCGSTDGCS